MLKKIILLSLITSIFSSCKSNPNSTNIIDKNNISSQNKTNNNNIKTPIFEKINLNSKILLSINESKKIDIEVLDTNGKKNNSYILESLDQSIIKVSNNILLGLKKGETWIKVYNKQDDKKTFLIPAKVEDIENTFNFFRVQPTLLSLKVGAKSTLKANLLFSDTKTYKDGNIQWATNNPKIVEIDDKGMLKALSLGETYIDAFYKDNNGKIYNSPVKVFVSPDDNNSEKELIVDEINSPIQKLIISTGEKFTIKPTTRYSYNRTDNNILFFPEDTNIISVNSYGEITALKEGFTTLKLKAGINNKEFDIPILVVSDNRNIKNIELDQAIISLNKNKEYKIKYDENYLYQLEDKNIASIDKGIIKGISEGITKISIIDKDNPELKSYIKLQVLEENIIPSVFLQDIKINGNSSNYEANLNWNKIDGINEYSIIRDKEIIGKTKDNNFLDKNLNKDKYLYQIKACKDNKCSDILNERTILRPLPSIPSNITSNSERSFNNLNIKLNWDKLDNITEYRIYRDNQSIGKSTTNYYLDTFAERNNKSNYDYQIEACNSSGCSEKSIIFRVNIPKPNLPNFKSIKVDDNKDNSINWIKENNISYYKLYKDNKLIYIGNSDNYTDKNKDPFFKYRLQACNSSICSDYTDENGSNLFTLEKANIISAKTYRIDNINLFRAVIEWNGTLDTNNNGIYKLYRNSELIYSGTSKLYQDDNLNTSDNYYFVETCNNFRCLKSNIVKSVF